MEWLDRFISVMDTISDEGKQGLGVSEISRRTSLTKGTLHRILRNMVEHRLVVQDTVSKKYRLGYKSMMWGSQFLSGLDTSNILSEYCDTLAEETGLYTHLSRFDTNEVFCIYTRQPNKSRNKYFVHVGQRMPLHCAAAAKSILAFQPKDVAEGLLLRNQPLTKYTDATKTEIVELKQEMEEISTRSIAFCEEELEEGVTAVSTPVFHDKDNVVLSISIVGSSKYINENRYFLTNALLEIGQKASQHLGYAHVLTTY